MVWMAFGLSLAVLLGLARWNLWAAMVLGAGVLGFLTTPAGPLLTSFGRTLADPGVVALAVTVGLIPLVGAVLERTGRMESLLARVPRRKAIFAAAPAIFGLLPIPGGALLSAPFLERVGGGRPEDRAAANVWFRHVFLFVYPVSSALIAAAKLAGTEVWRVLPYQLPWAVLAGLLGWAWLLRPFSGPVENLDPGPHWSFLFPLAVLLVAPALDLLLKRTVSLPAPEVATLIAVTGSFFLALRGGFPVRELPALIGTAKPWRFSLIVVGMFLYLAAFQASGLPGQLAALALPPLGLVLGVGVLMGLATGRQQAAISVVIPVYLAAQGSLSPWAFSVVYQAAYLGYLLSPLHPCLTVSAEYAGTTLGATWRRLLPPSGIALLAAVAVGFAVL